MIQPWTGEFNISDLEYYAKIPEPSRRTSSDEQADYVSTLLSQTLYLQLHPVIRNIKTFLAA